MNTCFVCGKEEAHQNHQYQDASGNYISKNHDFAVSRAEHIVNLLVKDFTDRRGLRQEWEQIDEEIQQEIRKTWEKIVERGIQMTMAWPEGKING